MTLSKERGTRAASDVATSRVLRAHAIRVSSVSHLSYSISLGQQNHTTTTHEELAIGIVKDSRTGAHHGAVAGELHVHGGEAR